LFTARSGSYDNATVEVMSLQDRRRKTIIRGGTYGRYVANSKGGGYLIYYSSSQGEVFAAPFDLNTLEMLGTPVPVIEGVFYNSVNGSPQIDFSHTGTVVYRKAVSALLTVQWIDSEGKTQPLLTKPGDYHDPRLSPDGKRLALEILDGPKGDAWIYDLQRDTITRLTFDTGGLTALNPISSLMNPVWSPDGHYIIFQGQGGTFWIRSDGAGKPQILIQSKNDQISYSFTADGKRLSYQKLTTQNYDLWTAPIEIDGVGLRAGKPEVFLNSPFDERRPAFSPDGHWLAYDSNESGTYQVYVRAFPDTEGKWQVSSNGGYFPLWSHHGHELFFRATDNRIMVVDYTVKGDAFVVDKPRAWSEKPLVDSTISGIGSYDLAPDDKRVAALAQVDTPELERGHTQVIFLENFFDELRRRAPLNPK
jgi:serine/threonine-protein kinase